ncbi:hypothetical protein [Pseudooceanicola sp. HF7]|uniref:hypothetical protein n=1 Tax=Pseudooceanicola sp. HF7 TaxID=2721560 RepID=UPI001430367E|nr:hypothetical protein [Pseudooceanicola sp. HF7]NIZ08222.1 hypothetical protein [Pseudooceanicola sp. HF7]
MRPSLPALVLAAATLAGCGAPEGPLPAHHITVRAEDSGKRLSGRAGRAFSSAAIYDVLDMTCGPERLPWGLTVTDDAEGTRSYAADCVE